MKIFPAIDIKDGKCVRLLQGKFDKVTVYSEDPVKVALRWQRAGAEFLHLVNLDGARSGIEANFDLIEKIVKTVKIPVQLGGGIRNTDTIRHFFKVGVSRIILGTSAVENPAFLKEILKIYGDRIIIGIDAKDGKVAVEGWEKTTDFTAIEFAGKMEKLGAQTIIYTDIATDGMMSGPNIEAVKEMTGSVGIDVIASGGVSSIDDLKKLKEVGVFGAIIGKALYTGAIDLKEALLAAGS